MGGRAGRAVWRPCSPQSACKENASESWAFWGVMGQIKRTRATELEILLSSQNSKIKNHDKTPMTRVRVMGVLGRHGPSSGQSVEFADTRAGSLRRALGRFAVGAVSWRAGHSEESMTPAAAAAATAGRHGRDAVREQS